MSLVFLGANWIGDFVGRHVGVKISGVVDYFLVTEQNGSALWGVSAGFPREKVERLWRAP